MNRRGFLTRLLATAAVVGAHELDLDRLLWVPGEKTIFLPTFEPHTFETCDWIADEALRILKERLQFAKCINREYESPLHVGDRLEVRLPQRFRVQDRRTGIGETLEVRLSHYSADSLRSIATMRSSA